MGVEDSDLNTFLCAFLCFERCDFSENVSMLGGSLVPQNDIVISQECHCLFMTGKIIMAAGPGALCGFTDRPNTFFLDTLKPILIPKGPRN